MRFEEDFEVRTQRCIMHICEQCNGGAETNNCVVIGEDAFIVQFSCCTHAMHRYYEPSRQYLKKISKDEQNDPSYVAVDNVMEVL